MLNRGLLHQLVMLAAIISSAVASLVGMAASAESGTTLGAISMPAFTYPPSSLSSMEQQQAYARALAMLGDGTIPSPRDPKIVKLMRDHVEAGWNKRLPALQQQYPVTIENGSLGGVEVIRVRPKGGVAKENKQHILLNLHGGAFVVGWPSVALLDAIPVAALSGIEVVTINYRRYPETVHPGALEDLTKVYREILKDYQPRNIGIFGGSAGGVITLQAIPWLKAQNLPLPAAIAPLACGFQTAVGDSAIWNFKGGFSLPGTTLVATGGYFGDHSRTEWVPGTSPDMLADYPPTLWMAGTRAPEMSGAITAHAKMLKKGIESELYMIEGGWHSSYSTAPETPESQDAMRYVAHWFDKRLSR